MLWHFLRVLDDITPCIYLILTNDPFFAIGRPRPLYDVPYMFEAREFLRKKLIGKRVSVKVDYVQPPANNFPEKICCTVNISNR